AFLALWIVALGLSTAACQGPAEAPPIIPGTSPAPNADFLQGSSWINESPLSPFRELRLLPEPDHALLAVVDGARAAAAAKLPGLPDGVHRLRLVGPGPGQKLLAGYPVSLAYPYAVLFTDNAANPSVAQLALLVPLEAKAFPYFVLLGTYVKGLDTMEWEMFVPKPRGNGGGVELEPAPATFFKGELVFRRR
ncbi:MAG: hypothetical protein HY075_16040, partial [Deltaproteobacteria bacterium]|nr:hypothetical protein [Deltaproteobacteria bacterium]